MDYPKNPAGLNKDEHYIMADQVFGACRDAARGSVPMPSVKAETPAKATPKRIVAWPRKRAGKRIA